MSDHSAAIDALMREALEIWQIPGASLAVVQGDEVVYLKAFGVRERGRDEAVTPDTLFAIGSTTKAITTTAMAMLVDDGNVAEKAPDHATPHRKKEEKIEVIPWRNLDNVAPAGSINAGARDMSRWIRFQLGGGEFEGKRLLSEANSAETHTPQMPMRIDENMRALLPETMQVSYGLGWGISDYRGHLVISHGGGIDGFRATVHLAPRAKLGLVVLANLSGNAMPEAVANSLLDRFLGLPEKDWNGLLMEQTKKAETDGKTREKEREEKRHKNTQPSRELAAYTGAYEEPAYGTASVSLENGSLQLQWSSFHSRLDHFHFDTFTAKDENPIENQQVLFTLGADGELSTMNFLGQEFRKVPVKS